MLFLDADGNLEELGGMNVVLVAPDGTLITPVSDPSSRASPGRPCSDWPPSVDGGRASGGSVAEWRDSAASGDIVGAFACGTAAVIVPIGRLLGEGIDIVHAGPESETLARSLREELTGIQYGRLEDRHGWMTRLDG